jgi:beta-galactosidase
VVASKGAAQVTDETRFQYQTEKWDQPARFVLEESGRAGNIVTVQARLLDAKGVPCLDARTAVRFALAGDGELIQNLGTSTGSHKVELYNGRAIIRVRMNRGAAAITVSAEKLPTALLTITS